MIEFWRAGGREGFNPVERARAVEADGWDGQMFMDSQSLTGDPWVVMGAWAASTSRLKLSTGVTNPLTRHLAVTAASAAMLHAISGGRAVLGIGRGDSALAYLGRAPVGVAAFERALRDLQTLLAGGEVAFGKADDGGAPGIETLSLGHRPSATRLEWLPKGLPKVPLDVAATGPKVIDLAAPIAERVTFSVGAIPERIGWALEIARAARARRGLNARGVAYGAQIIVGCHPDVEVVLPTAANMVAPLARFQVMQGSAAGPKNAVDEQSFATIRRSYDMTRHGMSQGNKVSRDFVQRFAIVGPPEHCIARLLRLVECGIERFVVVGPGMHPEARGNGRTLFATEVIPAVRAAAGRKSTG